jgi:hypothetical protein
MKITCQRLTLILAVLFFCAATLGAEGLTLEGEWVLVPQASIETDLYVTLTIEIARNEGPIFS